ncbi:MAG TPA: tetratricopeptide repeat protein [Thermoanaerobaculia bacterium]|nr:tetratricopeptide repeat protein [Thermoanaerobaculia bacterium]
MRPWPDHPPRAALERLVRSGTLTGETREIVRHLLAGCPTCGRMVEETRSRAAAALPRAEETYDAVFDRLEGRLLARGAGGLVPGRPTASRSLYSELLGHQAVAGLFQVHSTRRYASLALCELLLHKSRELALPAPEQARRALDLAAAAAEQLDLDLYGAPVVQDTRAMAWAYLDGTRQVQADLRSAESSMAAAGRLLAAQPGHSGRSGQPPRLRAELLTLQASLRAYGGRFEEALGLLNRAATIYRRAGDRHLLGRTLLKKGTVLGNAGRPDLAVRLIRRSMDLIDPPREPRLMVCATHNFIWFLNESGRAGEASASLQGARRLYRQAGDRRHLGRLRWLEGKLAPRLDGAEGALSEARDELAREGLSYEAALAAMDLAVLYAGESRGAAMRRQADQMLPLFRSGAMYRETMVALLSFQKDADKISSAELIEELGNHLHRAREEKNPPGLVRPLG